MIPNTYPHREKLANFYCEKQDFSSSSSQIPHSIYLTRVESNTKTCYFFLNYHFMIETMNCRVIFVWKFFRYFRVISYVEVNFSKNKLAFYFCLLSKYLCVVIIILHYFVRCFKKNSHHQIEQSHLLDVVKFFVRNQSQRLFGCLSNIRFELSC